LAFLTESRSFVAPLLRMTGFGLPVRPDPGTPFAERTLQNAGEWLESEAGNAGGRKPLVCNSTAID
jgi:hypothetical protein